MKTTIINSFRVLGLRIPPPQVVVVYSIQYLLLK